MSTRRTLPPATQIKTVVADLRAVIDELDRNFASAKSLILELARLLDETKQCEQSQICTKIKQMLKDKIQEGKITEKWIEHCLPQEDKRRYASAVDAIVKHCHDQDKKKLKQTPYTNCVSFFIISKLFMIYDLMLQDIADKKTKTAY